MRAQSRVSRRLHAAFRKENTHMLKKTLIASVAVGILAAGSAMAATVAPVAAQQSVSATQSVQGAKQSDHIVKAAKKKKKKKAETAG